MSGGRIPVTEPPRKRPSSAISTRSPSLSSSWLRSHGVLSNTTESLFKNIKKYFYMESFPKEFDKGSAYPSLYGSTSSKIGGGVGGAGPMWATSVGDGKTSTSAPLSSLR